MRRILIDEVVRGHAWEYRRAVETTFPDVVGKLKQLALFVSENNEWNDSKAIVDYVDMIEHDYPNLLTLEPKEWGRYKDKYAAVLSREPGMLAREVVCRRTAKGKEIRGKLYEKIIDCLQYDRIRPILGDIHQRMGLKTCVYCNASPARTGEGGDVFYQMDHFLPQSAFPFLGTCFYNLQPSCANCNDHKNNADSCFCLYVNPEQMMEISPFLFQPQVTRLSGMGDYDCVDVQFTGKDGVDTEESGQHDGMFHIHSLYTAYKSIVKDLYNLGYKMTPSYIEATTQTYGIRPTREDVLAFMKSFPTDENKVHADSLVKLKQDTLKQMKKDNII